ncbi:MAG TPA: NAD(+) synthase, partial [Polyangiales bacterium]|nr:NAD(+) synthase [Polyangiales bacterium]
MFSREVLTIDAQAACTRIAAALREQVLGTLRKKGVVVGMSGGIDSSAVAALSVLALGAD